MWVATRLFYKNRMKYFYHDEIMEAGQYYGTKENGEFGQTKSFRDLVQEQMFNNRPVLVDYTYFRFDLLDKFGDKELQKHITMVGARKKDEEIIFSASNKLGAVNDVIDSCISASYLEIDKETGKLFITRKGRRFITIDGFIKATGKEITGILGAWRTVILAVIATAGIIKIDVVVGFLKVILEKFF